MNELLSASVSRDGIKRALASWGDGLLRARSAEGKKALQELAQRRPGAFCHVLDLVRAGEAPKTLPLRKKHVHTAILAFGKEQLWQQALRLFSAMPEAKLRPGVISFNSTVSALEK
ncbi:unnamed protein product, partial [Symbiodinium necroappetens]